MNDLKAFKLLMSIAIIMMMFIVSFNMFMGPSLVPSYRDYQKIYKHRYAVNKAQQNNLDDVNNVDNGYDDEDEDELLECVNINEADKEQLQTLPGIGEAMAERIIKYREENGNFEYEDELLNIEGIGDKKFNKIVEYITVE